MTFLNPLVLLGLAAASIPLLLHLLNLRKLRVTEFSTLRFLKELQKTKIRRLKLKRIILLILRMLIVIFSVLAFARPTVKTALPALGAHIKSSVVILIDNSFSMDASDGGGNRLKQAKTAALSILSALKDGDEVAVITLTDAVSMRKVAFSRNLQLIRSEISGLKVGFAPASLEDGLRSAEKIMQSSVNLNKEAYIITDAQRNIFTRKQNDSLRLLDNVAAVFVVPIGGSEIADINLTVDSVNVISRIFALDKPVEVEAIIRNSGKHDAKGVSVGLAFDGQRMAQRTVDIPAGESRSVAIVATPHKSGIIQASIELENDALEFDNKRFFGFIIADKPRVALFGDEPHTRFLSLLFAAQDITAEIAKFPSTAIGGTALQNYDVIITNCEITPSDASRIEGFVRAGGGALIFANENNSAIYSTFGLSVVGLQSFETTHPAQFTSIDRMHPLFEGVFKGSTDVKQPVESPNILKAMPIVGGQSLISMNGGSFLAEQRLGSGRLLACAVPPEVSWGNFPLTGIFPAIVVRSISYAAIRESFSKQVIVGEPTNISLPQKNSAGGAYKIIDPSGFETIRKAATLPGGTFIDITPSQPGIYRIYTNNGNPVAALAANPPSSEGNLSFVSKTELKNLVGSFVSEKTPVEIISETASVAESVARARVGSELWKACIVAALLCAIAEMLVARSSRNSEATE